MASLRLVEMLTDASSLTDQSASRHAKDTGKPSEA